MGEDEVIIKGGIWDKKDGKESGEGDEWERG